MDYPSDLLRELNEAPLPPDPPSPDFIARLVQHVQDYLYASTRVCVVCDAFKHPEDCSLVLSGNLPKTFFTVLRAPVSLDAALRQQYDISDLLPQSVKARFSPLLLSRKGVVLADGNHHLCLCGNCLTSLKRSSLKSCKDPKPPKFAIANGFVIGSFFSKVFLVLYFNMCVPIRRTSRRIFIADRH